MCICKFEVTATARLWVTKPLVTRETQMIAILQAGGQFVGYLFSIMGGVVIESQYVLVVNIIYKN